MSMKRSKLINKSFFSLLFILFLLIHIGTLFFRVHLEDRLQVTKSKTTKPIKVKVIKVPLDLTKQIVQSSDSEKREVVEGAFLSDKTRSFDRQTRARKNGIFSEGAPSSGGGGGSGGPKGIKLSDLGAGPKGSDPFKEAAIEYTKNKNGKGSGDGKLNRKVSSTNDYIEHIPLGDVTNLNTVEYKYYGFYHRIRQKLEQFWGRSLQDKAAQMAKNGRAIQTSDELITALQITLDENGEITAIKVLGTSGVQELDDAAIESFNEAGPFPNPPKGMIVDGKVTLEWGFVVKS